MQVDRTVKSVVAFALTLSLVAGGVHVHNQFEEATDTINRLEQKVNSQNAKINTIKEDKTNLENDINKLNKTVDKLNKMNKKVTEEKAKLKKQIEAKKPKKVSKETRIASRGSSSSIEAKATFNISATAYTAFCNTGCTGVTATGKNVSNTIYHNGMRIIAVDPSIIPLNSIVVVRLGDGTMFKAIALDTGGAIKGYKLDLLVDNKDKAWNFGRQDVTVKVIEWG
jgi:3D (Asp-Asp-Asp) domain-containing protein/cell division protein FtsB